MELAALDPDAKTSSEIFSCPALSLFKANKLRPCNIWNIEDSLRSFSLDIKQYIFNLCCLPLVSECYKAQVLVSFTGSPA